jgi:hypothetical protein
VTHRSHGRHRSHAPRYADATRRQWRRVNWMVTSRIAGIVLLAAALAIGGRGVAIAAVALGIGMLVERLLHRPTPLERDRSRRHLTRNLGVGLTAAAAIFLYAFALGDPTSHLRPAGDRSAHSEAEDRAARAVTVVAAEAALGSIALALLFFGFDRKAGRRAKRRRSAAAAGGVDPTPPVAPA